MMKKLSIVLSAIMLQTAAYAQDIHFSQFYENAILRNPALTGIFSGDYKAGVNYRTQWSNISVPFQTMLASAETRIAVNKEVGDYVSIGVSATYDRAGSINFTSMQVYPAINYNKVMQDGRRSYLSVGFTGGYIQRAFDMSKATFSTQYINGGFEQGAATGENMQNVSLQAYDLGAGMSFNSTIGPTRNVNYYVGIAGYHVAKPKQTFNDNGEVLRLDTKWTGNLGVKASITNQIGLTVHANYTTQGPYTEMIAGALVSWRATNPEMSKSIILYGGAFIRIKDAWIPTVKIDYNQYSVTASYDFNTSGLRPATNGTAGYEISLFVRGRVKHRDGYRSSVACPRFEQMLDGEGSEQF